MNRALSRDCASELRNCGMPSLALEAGRHIQEAAWRGGGLPPCRHPARHMTGTETLPIQTTP